MLRVCQFLPGSDQGGRGVVLFEGVVGMPEPWEPLLALHLVVIDHLLCRLHHIGLGRRCPALSDLEKSADDDAHILCAQRRPPSPAAHESPSVLCAPAVLAIRVNGGDELIQVVHGRVFEELGAKVALQHHVHVRVALLALHKADTHLGKQLVEALQSGFAPRLEAREEVGRVQHAVVEAPVPNQEELGLG